MFRTVGPPGALDPVRDAPRAATASVRGTGDVPRAPHLSLAYASADGSGDAITTWVYLLGRGVVQLMCGSTPA
jgi:hypothetical protein